MLEPSAPPLNEMDSKPSELESINLSIYFVPPVTMSFMKWGECVLVILFLGIMFSIIVILYVNFNMNEYQARLDVISNGKLYGVDPQLKFEKYIKDTQAESIATAMGTIDKSTDILNRAVNRMDDKSSRLTRQLANDTKTTSTSMDGLGKAIQDNVGKLGGFMEKLGGAVTLNSYMSGEAIKTTRLAPGSAPSTGSFGLGSLVSGSGPSGSGPSGSGPSAALSAIPGSFSFGPLAAGPSAAGPSAAGPVGAALGPAGSR
jgi:hypothetical protein